jgi:hypothetical protein
MLTGSITSATEAAVQNESIVPFSRAKILVEFNATAEDVGVQVLLDGEPWETLLVFDPSGRHVLEIATERSLMEQGLTELFFESSEPSLDDLPLEEFYARFPAGEYSFEGESVEGERMTGRASLSHLIPEAPEVLSPLSRDDSPPVVNPNMLIIEWEPVRNASDGSPIEVVGYEVIVEQVEPRRVLSMVLEASVTSLVVAPEFFVQRNAEHKFEVLAIAENGNQTITEGSFITAP